MHARLSVCFDQVADMYDASRGGVERGARIAADVVPWLVPGRVLEVGVGTGIVAAALRARGRQVHGVDLSAAMLRRALDRLGPTVVQADALALPVASAALDNVLFVAALHVIGDVAGAVAEAARVLRPGGRLVAVYGVPKREPADDDIGEVLAPLALLRGARPDTPAAILAAALPVGLGLGVAAGWLAAAGYARPAHPRLSLAALGLAALATCAGAIAAAAADRQGRAGGVGALMRRVPGRDNAQWVAAGELVAAVCAIAGVVLLRTGADNATGVALLTPALVALATGLIAARALVPVAAAVGRRLLARGRVGHGLALLSLGRRPGVHRAIVLVTVGLAMLGSAIGAWTLAAAARAERADRTLGAARVLTVGARV